MRQANEIQVKNNVVSQTIYETNYIDNTLAIVKDIV